MSAGGSAGPIVIVGAGQAGARAAEALRATGFAGEISLIGEERHQPYERPQLSKELLLDATVGPVFIRSAQQWQEIGVALHMGAAVVGGDSERRVVGLADGREFRYERLLIATGARPRRLAALEQGPTPVLQLRGIEDSFALRSRLAPGQRLVLVGGGVIGLEVAAAAVERGCRVAVVEAAPALLAQIGSPILSRRLHELHQGRGVELRYGATAVRNVDGGVELSDGTRLAADCLVVGIGVTPNVELASALGLGAEDGIRVDAEGGTGIDRIHAAGDVAQQFSRWHRRWMRIENWANAQNQAIAVARAMLGEPYAYQAAPWFWSDQFGVNLQVVGNPAAGEQVPRGEPDGDRLTVASLLDGEIVGAVTWNNARDMAALRRLVTSGARVARTELEDPAIDLRRLMSR